MVSSSCSQFSGLMSLEELQWGVVQTFKPTDEQLVGYYLYNQIIGNHGANGKQAFPELNIYGKTGKLPWVIWDSCEETKYPHQEFLYFFSRVKKMSSNGKGTRCSRTVGCGGTWSETEPAKPVYVDGIQEPVGKIRKFRYENKNKSFEHHSAWMMDEFSIDHSSVSSSDLVLCRMKRNDNSNRRKRKFVEDEEENNATMIKSSKQEEQLAFHSHHEQQQLSDFDPREWNEPDCFLSGDNVDEKQGTVGSQQQQIHAPHFGNNYKRTRDDAVVPEIESEHAQLDDTGWLDLALEEVIDPSLTEQQTWSSSLASQMQANLSEQDTYTVPHLAHIKSEWQQPMDQISEAQGKTEDEAYSFAYDDISIPTDYGYFKSDEFSNFNFGDQFLTGGDDEL